MLNGQGRHELSCSACGAPLHELKMLRTDRTSDRAGAPDRRAPPAARRVKPSSPPKPQKPRKAKRRKGLMARVLDDAFDAIEDLFD